ncbi:MAG: tetratricopeptide repeat protein [Betaproteobacteria bacterium]|nr:tetratricopeptide repeat protein [Betaproteobacteria bacterium]
MSADLFEQGTRLLGQGRAAEAAALLRAAVALQPGMAEAHANLALALERGGGGDDAARAHHLRALALAPARDEAWCNYGAFLERDKQYAQAEQAYREALRLAPGSAAAWSNLGVLLDILRRSAEAEQAHRRAVALAPHWPQASVNLAQCLLRQGRMEEGWRYYEARDWSKDFAARVDIPRWDGGPLQGRALLLGVEGGQGDMIQFCRYAPELKRRGASVLGILCHPALQPLLCQAEGIDHAIAVGPEGAGRLPEVAWDLWCPTQSLPALCATRLESIPADLPYLRADPARATAWEHALDGPAALRVGLVWKGNPRFANDRERSLPGAGLLAPLGEVPGVRLFSLQWGGDEPEADAGAPPMVALGAGIRDFADTAAIVSRLDLVISVDTAVAHLAGALARPCWVLLPRHKTDWRWLEQRSDSPWYPGVMRLYRQGPGEDWSRVIAELARDLRTLAGARPAPTQGPGSTGLRR